MPGLFGVFLLHPTLGLCVRFPGLLQPMTSNGVAEHWRNLFAHSSGGQKAEDKVSGDSPSFRLVRAILGVPWLAAASLQLPMALSPCVCVHISL